MNCTLVAGIPPSSSSTSSTSTSTSSTSSTSSSSSSSSSLSSSYGAKSPQVQTKQTNGTTNGVVFPHNQPNGSIDDKAEKAVEEEEERTPLEDAVEEEEREEVEEEERQRRDRHFLWMAVLEARKSERVPSAYCVGAVVVRDTALLSSGFSRELPGNTHAEECAMLKAPTGLLSGSTMYTTIEPCTTRLSGKESCSKKIIESGIRRVVVGIREPDHFVRCEGVETLRAAGVRVVFVEDYRRECLEVNDHLLDKEYITAVLSLPVHPAPNGYHLHHLRDHNHLHRHLHQHPESTSPSFAAPPSSSSS